MKFTEVEHEGDLDSYCHDISDSGALVVSTEINEDEEYGIVEVDVDGIKDFREKFSKTKSYEFLTS